MKKLFIILTLALLSTQAFGQDSWSSPDKKLHLVAGGLIAWGATIQTKDPIKGFYWGCGAGLAKEVLDIGGTGFSEKDLIVTCLGAGIAASTTNWLVLRKNNTNYIVYSMPFKN